MSQRLSWGFLSLNREDGVRWSAPGHCCRFSLEDNHFRPISSYSSRMHPFHQTRASESNCCRGLTSVLEISKAALDRIRMTRPGVSLEIHHLESLLDHLFITLPFLAHLLLDTLHLSRILCLFILCLFMVSDSSLMLKTTEVKESAVRACTVTLFLFA